MSDLSNYISTSNKPNGVNLLSPTYNRQNHAKSSSFFLKDYEEKKVANEEKISIPPVDFFIKYFYLIDKITELINYKHGNRILDPKERLNIQADCYNDVAKFLSDNDIHCREDLLPKYIDLIFADILGLGMIEPLLNDPTVDEIMVKSHDAIYIERFGKIELSEYRFPTVDNAIGIVKKIITPLNLHIDAAHPNVNAQLENGSRLSASIPPLRARGEVSITIRKFKSTVEPLIYYSRKYQSSTPEMVKFLENAVKARMSMIVSGGTGSGKTTLLNSLSMAIPNDERLLTCEDTLELQLQQPHVEAYQTIEANMEGKGAFTMQQIIIEALRKRPDRIIVGECRGGEIVEMLNAMNTGHEGSLSTIHANTAQDSIKRMTTMILSNEATSNLTTNAIYQMLESSISLIIQTNRLQDGSRRITSITEIVGIGKEGFDKLVAKGVIKNTNPDNIQEDKLYLNDIFRFRAEGVNEKGEIKGRFVSTGYVPYCNDKMISKGFGFDDSFYEKRTLMEVNGKNAE